MMISRLGLRANRATRNFQTTARAMNKVYGAPETGVYSNLPFKVKGTKIPFAFKWWGTFALFFSFPFISAYVHLKRAGNL